MSASPKEKRDLWGAALQILKLLAEYRTWRLLARSLERPFWFCEQKRRRLQDELSRLNVEVEQ